MNRSGLVIGSVILCLCASYAALEEGAALPDMLNTVTSIVKPNTTLSMTAWSMHVTNMTAQTLSTTHVLTTVPPTLTPNFSLPETGQYNVSIKNVICIKARLGIQLFVKENAEDLHFNVPPAKTVVSGKCGNTASWIILKFNLGFVNFTFVKDGEHYYVSEISVALNTMKNLEKSYSGAMKNVKLFKTTLGHSYKCKSQQFLPISPNSLWILLVDTQLQAFDVTGGNFGKMEECFLDYRIIVPIFFGVSVFVLIIVIIIVYLYYRHRRFAGYQRI
ncbi:lysosome-associated membrane glycoprotein 3 isoform X2 [Stegostoma tigrinum]|uniref:lysosome-associated membrane glycoprotein 3 isoform X2 n=1 Tax=Stegostoma tigrinum TaxID=3053191 RepID=UPI00202B802B|nr:lysosome-associated membrane glycoprotein 3 isoform X2 [Stegostoma tigrinum]